MTAHEIRPYRSRLHRLVIRLSGDVDRLEAEALRPAGSETGARPTDRTVQEEDLPTQRAEEDVALSLLGNESHILAEATAALARIEAGTFGRCEECGLTIPHARLDAVPYARHCVRCAEQVESAR
jgi:RNA polymerase-binding transcription factor DksA